MTTLPWTASLWKIQAIFAVALLICGLRIALENHALFTRSATDSSLAAQQFDLHFVIPENHRPTRALSSSSLLRPTGIASQNETTVFSGAYRQNLMQKSHQAAQQLLAYRLPCASQPKEYCKIKSYPEIIVSNLHQLNCPPDIQFNQTNLGARQRLPRFPQASVLGAQKGGTDTLALNMLGSHPQVVPTTKELHFLDNPKFFRRKRTGDMINPKALHAYQKALKWSALSSREKLLQNQTLPYRENATQLDEITKRHASFYVDSTPKYFFFSSRIPHYMACITPWIKTVVLLRNPIDRAYSHYRMLVTRPTEKRRWYRGMTDFPSFEAWIAQDFHALDQTGVLEQASLLWSDPTQFNQSALDQAWIQYTSLKHDHPIGRGLYSIQLQHWYTAFDQANKSRSDMLLIQSETMKQNRDAVYRQVLQHFGLPYVEPQKEDAHVQTYDSPMQPSTRNLLEDFYRPYIIQLSLLLDNPDWPATLWELSD